MRLVIINELCAIIFYFIVKDILISQYIEVKFVMLNKKFIFIDTHVFEDVKIILYAGKDNYSIPIRSQSVLIHRFFESQYSKAKKSSEYWFGNPSSDIENSPRWNEEINRIHVLLTVHFLFTLYKKQSI